MTLVTHFVTLGVSGILQGHRAVIDGTATIRIERLVVNVANVAFARVPEGAVRIEASVTVSYSDVVWG